MSKKSKLELVDNDVEGANLRTLEGGKGESHEQAAPMRTAEILPHVLLAAQTITGCTDSQVKNAAASIDRINREVTEQLSAMWKEICDTAAKNGKKGEKPSDVTLAIKVDINQTNINLCDTEVSTGFSLGKMTRTSGRIQEDLTQIKMDLTA